MIDLHNHPENWGIRPVLFSIGDIDIPSYGFFVILGLIAGLMTYYILAKNEKKLSERSFYILIAALVGGILGSKIPYWIISFPEMIASFPDLRPFLYGRTIIGGLIGGTLAVWYIKKKLAIKEKKGNLFAPGIAIGVAIGRIGCLLAGCCYGIATSLPWGIDFGDGIPRHPTQIYEIIFMMGLSFFLLYKRKTAKPGYLYFLLMNSYFIFRFFEEFLREETRYFGFTMFQFISFGAIVGINLLFLRENKKG